MFHCALSFFHVCSVVSGLIYDPQGRIFVEYIRLFWGEGYFLVTSSLLYKNCVRFRRGSNVAFVATNLSKGRFRRHVISLKVVCVSILRFDFVIDVAAGAVLVSFSFCIYKLPLDIFFVYLWIS